MESINPSILLWALSLSCLIVVAPISGTLSVISVVLWVFEKEAPSCLVRAINSKIGAILDNRWVVIAQLALIIVLTPVLFLHSHAYAGESIGDAFTRLILHNFPIP